MILSYITLCQFLFFRLPESSRTLDSHRKGAIHAFFFTNREMHVRVTLFLYQRRAERLERSRRVGDKVLSKHKDLLISPLQLSDFSAYTLQLGFWQPNNKSEAAPWDKGRGWRQGQFFCLQTLTFEEDFCRSRAPTLYKIIHPRGFSQMSGLHRIPRKPRPPTWAVLDGGCYFGRFAHER